MGLAGRDRPRAGCVPRWLSCQQWHRQSADPAGCSPALLGCQTRPLGTEAPNAFSLCGGCGCERSGECMGQSQLGPCLLAPWGWLDRLLALGKAQLRNCGWSKVPPLGGPESGERFQAHLCPSWALQAGRAHKAMMVSQHWAGCKGLRPSGRARPAAVSE